MMRRPNRMKLHEALEIVRRQGKRGDTELAHVNPREKALLKAMGGVGTRNPRTGLRQYYAGVDPGSSYGEGGWGGAPESATSVDGSAGGYGATGGYGEVDSDYLSGAGTPQPAEQSFGERVGGFLGLNNPQRAGTAIAGFLGGTPLGLAALLGQSMNTAARNAGLSVIDPVQEREQWDAMFSGMPQGPGENINAALASYQPPTPQFTRAGEVAVPSEIAPFMGGDMSEMQRRALISTYGYMGTNPAFRDKPAQRYYASLLSRELVNPQMQLNQTPTLLPIEQQYLSGVMGIPQTDPAALYQGIRQFL
jgi:hypothetical protein